MNLKYKLSSLILFFCLFSVLFTNNAFAQNENAIADSAKKAFEKQQFKSAIIYYEKIIASGKTSSKLYYNLGNAYYRNNELGKSIYYYELAKKLNPSDEDIKANLRVATSKTIDKIDVKENYFINSIKSGVYSTFSTNGWAWLSIILITIGVLAYLLYVFSSLISLKRFGFWLGSISIIAMIIVLIIGYGALNNKNKKSQAIVLNQVVQVLNAPYNNAKSQFSLHEGTKVNVLDIQNEWCEIQLDNGNEGWVKSNEIGLF